MHFPLHKFCLLKGNSLANVRSALPEIHIMTSGMGFYCMVLYTFKGQCKRISSCHPIWPPDSQTKRIFYSRITIVLVLFKLLYDQR